jgi:DNA-binding PadR family transcriptional regulator
VALAKVELVVLGLLAEQPLHGYELLERFRSRSMGLWVEIGRASVYQALARLERRGLAAGRSQDGTEGPDRRVFRITPAGRARLQQGVLEDAGRSTPYESVAGTALGFLHLLPPAQARSAAEARERSVRDLLARIQGERERTAAPQPPSGPDRMLDRQEALARAELTWLRGFRASLGGPGGRSR